MHTLQFALVSLTLWAHWEVLSPKLSTSSKQSEGLISFLREAWSEHPSAFLPLIGQFLSIATLYGLFFALVFWAGRTGAAHRVSTTLRAQITRLAMAWAAICWLTLRINSHFFPQSIWAWVAQPVIDQPLSITLDLAAALWIAWRIGIALHQHLRAHNKPRPAVIASLFAASTIGLVTWQLQHGTSEALGAVTPTSHRPPNVIIIGLDSVRNDIALDGAYTEMPELQTLRRRSMVQTNVIAPLARTYPAWTTILTGKSPAEHGARFNLTSPDQVDTTSSIGHNFRNAGYRTIYATDETRFSNIGKDFGFDEVVAPAPGLADFVLGSFADTPLVNLAIQLPGAEWMLPSLVGNRAFAEAYRPRRFLSLLRSKLQDGAPEAPVFLAVHLCLAHWPYASTDTSVSSEPNTGTARARYRSALTEVDHQLGELQRMLHELDIWNDETLVVVLSDHGESFGINPTPTVQSNHPGLPSPGFPIGGHGGSLLDPAQWKTFAMFHGHSQLGNIPAGESDQLLSQADLPPAILALSGLSPPETNPLNTLRGRNMIPSLPHERVAVGIETGFRGRGLDPTNPDLSVALGIGLSSYLLRKDGRLEMSPATFDIAMQDKDFGVTDGKQVLVRVERGQGSILVHADFEEHVWSIYPVHPEDGAGSTPPPPLLDAACEDKELRIRIAAWCNSSPLKDSGHHL
ncbi:MAG: sulfatase-like hydrolase/transferase [Nevskiales bacterium]|nr:sulfatase-like hydrolase/transferase [Nevskiales bacterium]